MSASPLGSRCHPRVLSRRDAAARAASAPFGKGAIQHRFVAGRHLIKVNQYPKLPERERGGVERAIGIRLLAFIVDDLQAVLARSTRRSQALEDADRSDRPYSVAFTTDPEGNLLELVGLHQPGGDALKTRMQIGLTVADIERSRAFYGQTLGLPEEPVMEVGGTVGRRYGFIWGSTTIKFWAIPGAELPVHSGPPADRAGIRMFTVMVEDLAAAHAELVERGVPIAMPPTDLAGMAKIMFITDPDGNWIELAQRL